MLEPNQPGVYTPYAKEPEVNHIPILGTIKAGIPILSEENYDGDVDISQYKADFALRVSGDSMVHAGIYDGDLVLLKEISTAYPGQIVAASVTDGHSTEEATLKYFVKDRNGAFLRAANPSYMDMPFTEYHRILGVFAGLIREDEPSINSMRDIQLQDEKLTDEWAQVIANAKASGLEATDISGFIDMCRNLKK